MRALAAIFFVTVLTACGITKGYPGPELTDERLAILTFNDTSFGYDITYGDKRVDNYVLDGRVIKLLPGPHSADFVWSFETAADGKDTGLMASWKKSGRCRIDFTLQAGRTYSITASAEDSGSWLQDPAVISQVSEDCSGFLCKGEVVAKAACTYEGRTPSVYMDLDLGR